MVVSCACLTGVVMFAFYEDKKCDPFSSKKIAQKDQVKLFQMSSGVTRLDAKTWCRR